MTNPNFRPDRLLALLALKEQLTTFSPTPDHRCSVCNRTHDQAMRDEAGESLDWANHPETNEPICGFCGMILLFAYSLILHMSHSPQQELLDVAQRLADKLYPNAMKISHWPGREA